MSDTKTIPFPALADLKIVPIVKPNGSYARARKQAEFWNRLITTC